MASHAGGASVGSPVPGFTGAVASAGRSTFTDVPEPRPQSTVLVHTDPPPPEFARRCHRAPWCTAPPRLPNAPKSDDRFRPTLPTAIRVPSGDQAARLPFGRDTGDCPTGVPSVRDHADLRPACVQQARPIRRPRHHRDPRECGTGDRYAPSGRQPSTTATRCASVPSAAIVYSATSSPSAFANASRRPSGDQAGSLTRSTASSNCDPWASSAVTMRRTLRGESAGRLGPCSSTNAIRRPSGDHCAAPNAERATSHTWPLSASSTLRRVPRRAPVV